MFDGLVMFGNAVVGYLNPLSLTLAFGATLLGVVAGCMPGLSATLVITLLTTLTLKMQANQAILVLVCAYNGAIYGGSRTAILLNIPGTAANAAACIDGYQLARQGQAGRAMGIATTGSVVGTLFGLVCLALFTPLLGEIALKFGAFEFFWLALLGVILSGNVVAADPLKGWLAGFLGLFVAGVGQDGMYAYERFSFGSTDLAGGFGLIPVLVGAFGFSEVLVVMSERFARPKIMEFGSPLPRIMDVLRYWRTILRSGVIGVWIGILPGVGEDMAAWSSYATAKRLSKEPEKFGKGSIEGLMAAETGDNASVPGGIIPALALAIPGSAPCAVLLAAMIIHGVQAGPMLMVENPQFVYDVVAMVLFSTLGILFFGLFFIRPLLRIAQIPRSIMMPIIFVLCVIGSYSLSSRIFDVYTMLGFGTLIFIMRRYGYPAAPFVLGIVLGDILDKNLRRGLVLSDGELLPFFTRPLSALLALLVLYTFVTNVKTDQRCHGAGTQCSDRKIAPEIRQVELTACASRSATKSSPSMPFERQCAFARDVGYDGIEIAPFTLTDDPTRLPASSPARWRRAAADAGIAITSLHYLLRAPAGLSITAADADQRRRTVDVMRALCALAAELGAHVLVHGSPDQRVLAPGDEDEGRKRGIDCFAAMAEAASQAGVVYCIEPLARNQTAIRQHRRGGGRDRACDRQPGGADDDRLLVGRPDGGRADRRPGTALGADRPDRPHPFQRPEPPRPGRRLAHFRAHSGGAQGKPLRRQRRGRAVHLRARRTHLRRAPDRLSARPDRGQ